MGVRLRGRPACRVERDPEPTGLDRDVVTPRRAEAVALVREHGIVPELDLEAPRPLDPRAVFLQDTAVVQGALRDPIGPAARQRQGTEDDRAHGASEDDAPHGSRPPTVHGERPHAGPAGSKPAEWTETRPPR